MGGRGGSSGIAPVKQYSLSTDGMTGNEKQKKWARQIIDDAIRTVNANIKLVQANIERTKKKPSGAFHREMDTLTQIGDSLVKALKTYKSAGDLIDRRGQFEPKRIIDLINNINMQKSNGKWKPKK